MDEVRGFLTVRLAVHPAFLPVPQGLSKRELEYRARITEALAQGPFSLSELSRALGYKAISKRLSDTIKAMAAEGIVAKIATGGLRTKIALIV